MVQLNKLIKKPKTYTAKEKRNHRSLIGRNGVYVVDDMGFPVTILDERFRYGRLDVKIGPLNGHGEQWVEFHKVAVKVG